MPPEPEKSNSAVLGVLRVGRSVKLTSNTIAMELAQRRACDFACDVTPRREVPVGATLHGEVELYRFRREPYLRSEIPRGWNKAAAKSGIRSNWLPTIPTAYSGTVRDLGSKDKDISVAAISFHVVRAAASLHWRKILRDFILELILDGQSFCGLQKQAHSEPAYISKKRPSLDIRSEFRKPLDRLIFRKPPGRFFDQELLAIRRGQRTRRKKLLGDALWVQPSRPEKKAGPEARCRVEFSSP